MTKTVKAHHAGQRPTTIWMPDALAAELDRKLADAAQPGLRPSRSGFILHAIQSALGGAAAAPPAPGPTGALPAPTVQPVAPAQPVQAEALRPESEPPLPELLAAFRALFRARKTLIGTDEKAAEVYRDQTAAELAESDVEGTTLYQNLLDFARAGAAGLNEAPFCPVVGGWEDCDTPKRARVQERFLHIFRDLTDTLCSGVFDSLPGPFAAAQARHVEAQAKAKAREDKAAAKAARAAQRAAKKPAPAKEPEPQRPRLGRPAPPALPEQPVVPAPLPPMPQQLQPEQPALRASPFGDGPSES